MTLQEAKDKVCERHYGSMYKWEDLFPEIKLSLFDEVTELYARSKWDEACELQRKNCGSQILWGQQLSDIERNVYNATKPEFKP